MGGDEQVAELLGIGSGETVRKWLRQSEIDAGARAGTTSQESAEVRRLKRENADRSEPEAEGGLRWGVQPICTVLSAHGITIAPSTYYEPVNRTPTVRQERDELPKAEIWRVHGANYDAYGGPEGVVAAESGSGRRPAREGEEDHRVQP